MIGQTVLGARPIAASRGGTGVISPVVSGVGVIASAEAFGIPTLSLDGTFVYVAGIASAEVFGVTRVVLLGGAAAVAPSMLDVSDGALFLPLLDAQALGDVLTSDGALQLPPLIVAQDLSSVLISDATLQDVLIIDSSGV
jgi:hypothetical protein